MADHSAPATASSSSKKTKSNKKGDRASKLGDRSQLNLNNSELNEEKVSTEPYKCTGKFIDDFQVICKQSQLGFVPTLIHRAKSYVPPTASEQLKMDRQRARETRKATAVSTTTSNAQLASETLSTSVMQSEAGGGGLVGGLGGSQGPITSAKQQQQQQSLILTDHDENKEALEAESLPKTFILVKDNYEYFKPKIQVEQEHPDKNDTVTDIYIRGWRLEMPVLNVLHQTIPFCEKLRSLNLWYCGLNEDTFDSLLSLMPKCKNLKDLNLDGNPLLKENFHMLIIGDSIIQHLSLRNCQITDLGASKLGISLGTVQVQNTKLLSLNLSGNYITDAGAIELAKGLRCNRTLLVLNLAGNDIGDLGACKLAETLSRFKMTHEEILKRRAIKKERLVKEMQAVATTRKNRNESDRVSSMGHKSVKMSSSTLGGKKDRMDSSMANLKDRSRSKETLGRDSSADQKPSALKSRKDKDSSSTISASQTTMKKEKESKSKDNVGGLSQTTMKATKGKTSRSGKNKESDSTDEISRLPSGKVSATNLNFYNDDPLMDEAEGIEGDLWLSGNRTLISLNLSRNRITMVGLKEFLLCIQYQISLNLFHRTASSFGLLKLSLNKNDFPSNNEFYMKLQELMKTKDPMAYKNQANESIHEKDTMSVVSGKDLKETTRSKSSRRS